MNSLQTLIAKGGTAIIAIMVLSVLLYSRCFALLLHLRRTRQTVRRYFSGPSVNPRAARIFQEQLRDSFRQQRIFLGAMIAAAPLLGLLGTVNGMSKTFHSLSSSSGGKSMEGLARGVSEVLVATESGLMVALPALLMVYLAHREITARIRELNNIAGRMPRSPSP